MQLFKTDCDETLLLPCQIEAHAGFIPLPVFLLKRSALGLHVLSLSEAEGVSTFLHPPADERPGRLLLLRPFSLTRHVSDRKSFSFA